jgi:hypothetical protein
MDRFSAVNVPGCATSGVEPANKQGARRETHFFLHHWVRVRDGFSRCYGQLL